MTKNNLPSNRPLLSDDDIIAAARHLRDEERGSTCVRRWKSLLLSNLWHTRRCESIRSLYIKWCTTQSIRPPTPTVQYVRVLSWRQPNLLQLL